MISSVKETDLLEILEIEKSCFKSPYTEKMLQSSFEYKGFFGAVKKSEEIEGYLICSIVLDEANIDRVAVREKYRNQNVATSLIAFTEKELKNRGVKTVYLEVRVSNQKAINLYTKLGYENVAIRKKYYDNVEDAFVMEKLLVE